MQDIVKIKNIIILIKNIIKSKNKKSLYDYVKFFDKSPVIEFKEKKLDNINISNINKWIADPEVRVNLYNNINVSYMTNKNITLSSFSFNSDYGKHIDFLINSYLDEMYENMNTYSNDLIMTNLENLKKIILAGNKKLQLNKNDYRYIFKKVLNVEIIKQADDGNCYFSSISSTLDKKHDDVRNDLYQKFHLDTKFNNEFNKECPEGIFKNMSFADKIQKPCMPPSNVEHCKHCVWGTDTLNKYIAELYNVPVVSFSIGVDIKTREYLLEVKKSWISKLENILLIIDKNRDIDEDDIPIKKKNLNELFFDYAEVTNINIKRSISMSQKKVYVDIDDEDIDNELIKAELEEYKKNFITVLFDGQHVDAVKFM